MNVLMRRFRDIRYRLFYGAVLRKGWRLKAFGNRDTGCEWYFSPEGLCESSIVYSAGVGRDISFEHTLVEKYGCNVILMDPSPTGRETMELEENRIRQFRYQPIALSDQNGSLRLAPPSNPAEGSWYMQSAETNAIEVPCIDLETLMARNKHPHIDLLKMDIEGAEYGVLDHLTAKRLPVRQVLVEFHHGLVPGIRRTQTIWSILKLMRAGYRLLKQDGLNHTFLKRL